MLRLFLESSCDNACLGIVESLSYVVKDLRTNSNTLNKVYGGVVPNLIRRSHTANLDYTLLKGFSLILESPCIHYTNKPGLLSCLLITSVTSHLINYIYNKKLFKVDHQLSHLQSPSLKVFKKYSFSGTKLPFIKFLNLIVSGKTTKMYLFYNTYKTLYLRKTIDDSLGESFDKGARVLNLFALTGSSIEYYCNVNTNVKKKPLLLSNKGPVEFISYSGFKTKLKGLVSLESAGVLSLCNYYQQITLGKLIITLQTFVKKFRAEGLLISGGVIKNRYLNKNLFFISKGMGIVYIPSNRKYSEDNPIMLSH
jgi:N6-L-threonylcarbamoyladenine synthase